MIERIVILVILTALVIIAFYGWRGWLQRRTRQLQKEPIPDVIRALHLPARPTILYFTTAACTQCKYQQTPTLERLSKAWGDTVHVLRLDAFEYDDLAHHLGIMTAPTTVVLDSQQRLQDINHGVATADHLQSQLRPITRANA